MVKSREPFLTNLKESKSENIANAFYTLKENFSQESVSLLKDCYEEGFSDIDFPDLTETCINSQLELININAPEETDPECDLTPDLALNENFSQSITNSLYKKSDSSSQTDFSIYQYEKLSEEQIKKEPNFFDSLISLKYILTHEELPNKKLFATVKEKIISIATETNIDECISESSHNPVKEALKCPTSNSYKFFFKSVSSLLNYLEISLQDNLEELAYMWKGSLYELAVNILLEATTSDLRVQKLIDLFLCKLVDSIYTNKKNLKNLALESKATFVIIFCRSHLCCYNIINHIIEKLKKTIDDNRHCENSSLEEKLAMAFDGKNYYILLRILESLLESVKKKYEQEEVGYGEMVKKQNFNVLMSWKKLWTQHVPNAEKKTHHLTFVESKWCKQLDDILVYCVEHIPVLALTLERCERLAKDIFRLSHWKNGEKQHR